LASDFISSVQPPPRSRMLQYCRPAGVTTSPLGSVRARLLQSAATGTASPLLESCAAALG
jgi:hypothetical protein